MRYASGERRTGRWPRAVMGAALALGLSAGAAGPATAAGPVTSDGPATSSRQDPAEAVMVAAGEWALARLPSSSVRLDPHRSGGGSGEARARRVAGSLGAELGTLEDTRRCADVMDPGSCTLAAATLLAISPPRVEGDQARVKVYAWYRSDSPRRPVAQQKWELVLQQSGGSWEVVGGG